MVLKNRKLDWNALLDLGVCTSTIEVYESELSNLKIVHLTDILAINPVKPWLSAYSALQISQEKTVVERWAQAHYG